MVSTTLLLSPPTTAASFSRSLTIPFSSSRNPNTDRLQFSHSIRIPPRRPGRVLERSLDTKLRFLCSAVTSIGQDEFSVEVLESEVPVLVEFVASWCGPCRLISPVIEWASQEYEDKLKIVKIDHDANPRLIEEYKVYGLPCFILFKNGQEVPKSRREGAIAKAKLKYYLDSLLGSASAV